MPLEFCVLDSDELMHQGEYYQLDVLYNAKTDGGLNSEKLHTKINGKGPLLFVGKTNTKSDCSQLN